MYWRSRGRSSIIICINQHNVSVFTGECSCEVKSWHLLRHAQQNSRSHLVVCHVDHCQLVQEPLPVHASLLHINQQPIDNAYKVCHALLDLHLQHQESAAMSYSKATCQPCPGTQVVQCSPTSRRLSSDVPVPKHSCATGAFTAAAAAAIERSGSPQDGGVNRRRGCRHKSPGKKSLCTCRRAPIHKGKLRGPNVFKLADSGDCQS